MDGLARDIRGVLGGKEHIGWGDFFGLSTTAQRYLSLVEFLKALMHCRGNEGRPNWPRSNLVYSDAFGGEAQRERVRKSGVGALGRGVVQQLGVPFERVHRGRVDNARAFLQVGERGLAHEKTGKTRWPQMSVEDSPR